MSASPRPRERKAATTSHCVVLGRGGDEAKVIHWLRTGADVPGFVGFAVGRTIWWNPLEEWLAGAIADEVAATIAATTGGSSTHTRRQPVTDDTRRDC